MDLLLSKKKLTQSLTVAIAALSLSGCFIHVGGGGSNHSSGNGVSSVFGELEVSEGKEVANVSSVNGSIELHNSVTANVVDTVNGSIEMGNHVTVESADSVNGDIEAGNNFTSYGPIETVNGDIKIAEHSTLHQNVKTVNGDIHIEHTQVKGSLHTHNGDVTLTKNSIVLGDIVYRSNNRKHRYNMTPTLTIKEGSTVEGEIILQREVELDIEDAELLRKVSYQYSEK